MSMDETISKQDREKVQWWLDVLQRSQDAETRLRALAEVGWMAVRTRGAPVARGTLDRAAEARLPEAEAKALTQALRGLSQEEPRIRAEVAFAVGEWCDEAAVTILGHMAKEDTKAKEDPEKDLEARVRLAAVGALAKIGGPSAVHLLREVATDDADERVRARAVDGLGGLVLREQEEKPRPVQHQRTGGAVRARGAPSPADSLPSPTDGLEDLKGLLEQLREQAESRYVRTRAEGILKELTK
jgi:hypothetical protein